MATPETGPGAALGTRELEARAFCRKARQAAHQVLFFTGMSHPTGHPPIDERIEAGVRSVLEQIRAVVGSVGTGVENAQDFARYPDWHRLRRVLDSVDQLDLATAAWVHAACVRFLAATTPADPFEALYSHVLPSVLHILRRNLTLLIALAALCWAAFFLPQVAGLLWNGGWATAVLSGLLFLPALSLRFVAAGRFRRTGTVATWDLGGLAFRRLTFQARTPERGVRPFVTRHIPALLWASVRRRVGGQLGVWAVVCGLALVSRHLGPGVSLLATTTAFTLFLVLSLFLAVLGFARLIDFWDYLEPRPVRMTLLAAAGVLGVLANAPSGELGIMALAAAVAVVLLCRTVVPRRRGAATATVKACLVLVALVGYCAGSAWLAERRTTWREGQAPARPVISEAAWPSDLPEGPVVVLAASGGGSRAAVYAALTLERLHQDAPDVACRLQAIGSVSGGSLASAAYVASRLSGEIDCEAGGARAPGWLVPKVSRDFLQPVIEGLILPSSSRGEAIEREWSEHVGLAGTTIGDLARRWDGLAPPPFPVPLFNTATLDAHDVVISPLAWTAYASIGASYANVRRGDNAYDRNGSATGGDRPTWVFYRDGVYGLDQLVPGFDPSLAASVRASANFPFGFPLVRVDTDKPLDFSPDERSRRPGPKTLYLTDGGVLSNSGVWSLYHLIRRRAAVLEGRGLLLVIVEASRMPEYPDVLHRVSGLWGAIGNQEPVAQNLHRRMLEALGDALGDRFQVVQVDLVPTEGSNVMTTWALPEGALKTLRDSFDTRWPEVLQALQARWRFLNDKTQPVPEPKVPGRPPLD